MPSYPSISLIGLLLSSFSSHPNTKDATYFLQFLHYIFQKLSEQNATQPLTLQTSLAHEVLNTQKHI